MKVSDILQSELLEMADAKDPDKIAELIKKGDYDGAVKATVSKSSGKPLKSVARNVRELLDPEEVKKYRESLASTNPSTAKKGYGKKAAEKRKESVVKAATGDKTGSTSSTNQRKIKKKLEDKIQQTAQKIRDDSKLTDEEKEEHLAGLEILGQSLNVTYSGKGVLGKEVSNKAKQIARAKLAKDDPKELEMIKKLEQEAKEEEQEYKELAKEWKKKTGKTPEQSIDDAIASGLLRFRADKTVPKSKDEIEDEKLEKGSKNTSLKDKILGNSRDNK